MPRTGLWFRLFVGLLVAVMPPLLMLAAAVLLTESVFAEADPGAVAVLVVTASIGWAAILAIVFGRSLSEDVRSLLSVAERGDRRPDVERDVAYRQLADVLDERNRQVSTLTEQARGIAIDDEPRRVVTSLVSAVRRVMRDPTWRCAVMTSPSHDLLSPGIYYGREEDLPPAPLGDLERWASVSHSETDARHVEGPWGAFTAIHLPTSGGLRAILYAPWEGRSDPTPAEVDLQTLVGQHAGIALDHSLLYATVRAQADELTRLAAVQADFLRGVTHDLQTPLTSIGALAAELRANEQLPPSARADLDSITHQAERLRRMVGQLLVASRLEAGAFTPQQDVFAVEPLVERTWNALRADRPFEMVTEGARHLAVADPDRLEQVLWALLDNAIKYSPAGSPISVHIAPEDGRLAITVADAGMGMDATTRERAFDQFYRSEDARNLAPDGSGVGLYAARGIVAAMGGTIGVDSQLGAGTRLTVTVPAEQSDTGD